MPITLWDCVLQLREVQDMYEDSLGTLEDELNLIRRENEDLRDE